MESSDTLSTFIMLLEDDESAAKILQLMRQKDPSVLVLSNEDHPTAALNDRVCQHLAELGLKEVLDIIKSQPITIDHLYAGCVLLSIKDIHLVKKYIWRDKEFVPAMSRMLKHALSDFDNREGVRDNELVMMHDIVAGILQGAVLGGTPASVFDAIASSGIIEMYTAIFKNRNTVVYQQSYEKMILSLLVMCQDHPGCLVKCKQLDTASALDEFAQWDNLMEDIKEKVEIASQCIYHMSHQDELPEHRKVVLNKFADHMHEKNKAYKRMETIRCSNIDCSKVQTNTKEGRFKKCARCRVVLYCSKDCQKSHWVKGHSQVCVAPTGEI